MHSFVRAAEASLLLVVVLAAAGCSRQEEPSGPAGTGASAPAFPAGNGEALSLADCDRLPDPQPTDDSAAARSTAVSLGVTARTACRKAVTLQREEPNADLARIRAIKEKEQADLAARKVSEQEWSRRVKNGGSQPVREFKY